MHNSSNALLNLVSVNQNLNLGKVHWSSVSQKGKNARFVDILKALFSQMTGQFGTSKTRVVPAGMGKVADAGEKEMGGMMDSEIHGSPKKKKEEGGEGISLVFNFRPLYHTHLFKTDKEKRVKNTQGFLQGAKGVIRESEVLVEKEQKDKNVFGKNPGVQISGDVLRDGLKSNGYVRDSKGIKANILSGQSSEKLVKPSSEGQSETDIFFDLVDGNKVDVADGGGTKSDNLRAGVEEGLFKVSSGNRSEGPLIFELAEGEDVDVVKGKGTESDNLRSVMRDGLFRNSSGDRSEGSVIFELAEGEEIDVVKGKGTESDDLRSVMRDGLFRGSSGDRSGGQLTFELVEGEEVDVVKGKGTESDNLRSVMKDGLFRGSSGDRSKDGEDIQVLNDGKAGFKKVFTRPSAEEYSEGRKSLENNITHSNGMCVSQEQIIASQSGKPTEQKDIRLSNRRGSNSEFSQLSKSDGSILEGETIIRGEGEAHSFQIEKEATGEKGIRHSAEGAFRDVTPKEMPFQSQSPTVLSSNLQSTTMMEGKEFTTPFRDAVVEQIVSPMTRMVREGETRVKIALRPKEMGTLRIELITEKGVLEAKFTVESEEVRGIIEKSLPELKEALAKQDVHVESFDVNVDKGFSSLTGQEDKLGREERQSGASRRKSPENGITEEVVKKNSFVPRSFGYNSIEILA